MAKFEDISSTQLFQRLNDPKIRIIDVREADAYNGWCLHGESRGGHIQGARSLPLKWCDYIDWIEIVRAKDIRQDDELVIYGYEDEQAEQAAECFASAGFDTLCLYSKFLDEWSSNASLPMEKLPRYEHLIGARQLKELIDEGAVGSSVICHAHYRNREDYDIGHIPQAVELDTCALEEPETWNCRKPEEIRGALLELGITADTRVILYGRFSHPQAGDPFPGSKAGQLAAYRCALIMLWAGVKNVQVLNGGLQSWLHSGYELSRQEQCKTPAWEFGSALPVHPEFLISLSEAKEVLKTPGKNLVCVRSLAEYQGLVSGYNYIARKGRIPGAVFAECGSDAYHMENYRNLDHTMREYGEIARAWSLSGITPDAYNAFYCGTGWRAAEAFFDAWLMGWEHIAVFDGGWFEWSSDENNPVETAVKA